MVTKLRRAFIVGVILLSCCGVAASADNPGVWLNVPFVRQQKDGCGAASIAMVMQYWQRQQAKIAGSKAAYSSIEKTPIEYAAIQDALLSRSAHGIYASDMVRYFQQNGFAAYTFAGDWKLVRHHLAMGRPLIVALKPGWHQPLHYVVVVGVDRQNRIVMVNDPARRKLLKKDLSRFDREWKAAGNWTLLAVPNAKAR